jgi:site-specific DNA recombinase
MNTVVYCRVSSKEQIEGTSLEMQEAACREYARAKNLRILKVFVEQGESAKFADRTQLVELIDFCRENKGAVHSLLVWKIDRFARNVTDHFSVKATLGKYGVGIVSVTEPIDTNPEGKLMETILAGFAQFDNDIRAVRTVQGMRRRLHEGIFPWGPPLGYRSSVVGGEKKTQPDLLEQAVFPLLQKAWREFSTGAYTQAAMSRVMQTWGLTTAEGRPFSLQTLYQIFTNPYYAGVLIDPWSGEEHKGKHVPMVTRDEFDRVQQVIAGRSHAVAHQKEHPDFPLRGVVRCDGCRHYLTGAFSRGRNRRYPYYLCHERSCARRGKSCPAGDIHKEFDTFLDSVTPRPEKILRLADYIVQEAGNRQQEREAQRPHREKRATQLERELQELIRMRAQTLISDQEFLKYKKRIIDNSISSEDRDRRAVSIDEVRKQLQEIMNPLAKLRETWHELKPRSRRRFDRLLLPGGFVTGQSRTAQMGRLFSIIGSLPPGDSSGVPRPCIRSNQVIPDIQEFWKIMKGIEEPEPEPKRRFEHSHRNRLRWSKSNPAAA